MFCFLVSQCRNLNLIGWCLYYLCIHAFELSKHTSPTMIYFLCLFLSRLFFFFFSFLFFSFLSGFLDSFLFSIDRNLCMFCWKSSLFSLDSSSLCSVLFCWK